MKKLFLIAALAVMIPHAHAQNLKVYGGYYLSLGPTVIPTSLTAAGNSTNIDILQISFVNPSSSTVTVTVTDQQGTPLPFVPTISIPANGEYLKVLPYGYYCTGGFKWAASATGVVGYVVGR